MTTDFRALCAELHAAFTTYAVDECHHNLLERARAALAEAVPEGREPTSVVGNPTDEELLTLLPQSVESGFWLPGGLPSDWVDGDFIAPPEAIVAFARDVLELWGTPNLAETRSSLGDASQPVPVSERLPRSEDCDAEGKCWWGRSESNDWSADWTLATHEAVAEFCEFSPQTVWLPAHALPLPDTND